MPKSASLISFLLAFVCALAPVRAAAQELNLSGVLSAPEYEARELEKNGNWETLERVAAEWSEQDGDDWRSWYYYGLAEFQLGKADGAVRHLTLASELMPHKNAKLELMLADAHALVPNWKSAEKGYRRLLEENENSPQLWEKLRDVTERYLESLPQQVRDNSELAQHVRRELVVILQRTLQFRRHRDRPELWLRHAELLRAQGRDAEARPSYMRYLALNQTDLQVWEWVFIYDLAHADADTLRRTVSYMEKVNADNPLLRVYQARQAEQRNNKREARRHYKVASVNTAYPRQQAQALAGLGDLTEGRKHNQAMDYYKAAIHADPSHVHAWERIVVILRAQSKHGEARRYFNALRKVKEHLEADEPPPRSVLDGL